MEIPDVIVVNKADHPLTDTMVREIKSVLALGPHEGWQVPVAQDRGGPRRRDRGARRRKLAEHHAYIEAEGTLSERRRRNLLNEVLAIATYRHAPRARGLGARGPGRPGAARPRRRARARPGERGGHRARAPGRRAGPLVTLRLVRRSAAAFRRRARGRSPSPAPRRFPRRSSGSWRRGRTGTPGTPRCSRSRRGSGPPRRRP